MQATTTTPISRFTFKVKYFYPRWYYFYRSMEMRKRPVPADNELIIEFDAISNSESLIFNI